LYNAKYSVLMSIYYKENPNYFRKSVISMLEQTVKPDEIIIVKDGQLTIDLDIVIDEFKHESTIKIISLPENRGLGEALNIGMEHCNNEIIARMDTDDISIKDRCEKQLAMFLKNNTLSIVSSSVCEFSEDPNIINSIKRLPLNHEDIVKYAKMRNPFNHPAVMFKKSEVEKVGGYRCFNLFEDYYLWARMIQNGSVCANIEEPLVYMRANENMFKRRGGVKYFKFMIAFRWHLKKIGFCSIIDFFISLFLHGAVSLIPNKTRMLIYRLYLRN
jgi:glycosyltransferase involved in cell wall biosynthesis